MKNVAAIVMAGGRGVRMRMPTTKMLAPILGRPLVYFPTKLALETIDGPVVVVSGEFLGDVREALSVLPPERLHFARQEQPLGTADAVKAGVFGLPDESAEFVLILNGDVPGTSIALMKQMVTQCETREADICVLAFRPEDPFGYGRILTDDSGTVLAIREEKELAAEERAVDVVNAGLYVVRLSHLRSFLANVKPSPNQREFLLTDVVESIVAAGGLADVLVADDPAEVAGVNDQSQLSDVTARIRRQRNHELMMAGVAMPFPDSVEVELGVTVGAGTTLEANVHLRGQTVVGNGCTVETGSVLVDTALADHVRVQPYCVLESTIVAASCNLGPFAHTRPGTVLEEGAKVGNFVETKKATIGRGAKASHLSYIGDATVGAKANIGAGTITCNYDGYRKFPTHIGEGAFIGSDTQLVAPVNVGDNAVVAAGTTVTKDVPAGALAVSRVEQANRPGYSEAKRRRMEKDKE